MNITLEKFEFKKKDLLTIDNINGKNLMDYFEKMNEVQHLNYKININKIQ